MGKDILYETMKIAAKKRKIKASPQLDLYKRADPYFLNVFYSAEGDWITEGKGLGTVRVLLDIAVKPWRFDELRWGILSPGDGLKFTDKIRANSVAACKASFPRQHITLPYDGTEAGLPQLCEAILDWIEDFYRSFFETVRSGYGTLEEYYLAKEEEMPLLAGLVCLEREQYQRAERCFRRPNAGGRHSGVFVRPATEEQQRRANASCACAGFRSDLETLLDYTVAMQNGVEWTAETARYGLLPEERRGK